MPQRVRDQVAVGEGLEARIRALREAADADLRLYGGGALFARLPA